MGTDSRGNIVRIDNALGQIDKRIADVQNNLTTLQQQLAAAKAEVNKPFEFEEELAQRNARLIELDMQLNMDMQPEKPERAEEIKEPEAEIKQPEPALALAQRARESILERLRQPLPPRPEIAARAVKTKSYAMEL